MLAKRIIPCLDVQNGMVVKGVNFEGIKEVGDPVECAVAYDRQGADEMSCLPKVSEVHLPLHSSQHLQLPFLHIASSPYP